MATREYYTDIDLKLNQIKDVVVDKQNALPTFSAAEIGRIVTVSGTLYVNNGTEWKALATGADSDAVASRVTALETAVGSTTYTGDSITAAIAAAQTSISGITSDLDTATTGLKARVTAAENDIDALETSLGSASDTASASGSAYARIAQNSADIATKVDKVTGSSLLADTEITRLAGMETGAQVNVIETVKVNNVALTPTSKAVNIDLSDYAKKTDISAAFNYKGTKASSSALPTTGNVTGDVWNITAAGGTDENGVPIKAGDNVAWSGTGWDVLGGTTDLSAYLTSSVAANTYEPILSGDRAAAADSGITAAKVSTYDGYATTIAGKVEKLSSAPTAGTYTKVTINADGLVSAGASLAASDIPTIAESQVTNLTTDLAGKIPLIASATGGKLVKSKADGTVEEDSDATTKLSGIATGAQVNVIEDVKVNGTSLTVTSKAVDVTVPTKTSDITNNSDFQTSTQVSTAIGTALGSYYTKTQLDAQFGEAELTFENGVATESLANVWTAEVLDTNDKVVYCDVTIGASSVVVSINGSAPTGGLKLRYIKKPVAS